MINIKQTNKIGENSSSIALNFVNITRPHHFISRIYGLMIYSLTTESSDSQQDRVKVYYGISNYIYAFVILTIYGALFVSSILNNTHQNMANSTLTITQLSRLLLLIQHLTCIFGIIMDFININRISYIFNKLIDVDYQVFMNYKFRQLKTKINFQSLSVEKDN